MLVRWRVNGDHNHFNIKKKIYIYMNKYSSMAATLKWLTSDEANKISKVASDKARAKFLESFPNADMSQCTVQVDFDENRKATGEVFFKAGGGLLQSVFGSDRKYWSQGMKESLGLAHDGFRAQLRLNKSANKPIPAINFSESVTHSVSALNGEQNIFVTPTDYFKMKFRNIFDDTRIKHLTGKESREWLAGPNIRFWPQQLNFALWCATTGCGILREILFAGMNLTPQLRCFYQFHVYFTVRQILYEMGGIQSFNSLPGDLTFSQTVNMMFLLTKEFAQGLESPQVQISASHMDKIMVLGMYSFAIQVRETAQKKWQYPPARLENPSSQRFEDEGGTVE